MKAAGDVVHGVGDFGGRVASFAASLDDMHLRLRRLELEAAELGIAVAPLYLASARGSLRHVAACLAHQVASDQRGRLRGGELCPGTTIHLRSTERAGIGDRHVFVSGRARPAPGADGAQRARRPDLGVDVAGSQEAVRLCGGPVGAALLFDALSRHRWLHVSSGTKWSTDRSGAQVLTSIVALGASFPIPGPVATAGLVDRQVADMLADLGWLRLETTRMPDHATG